MGKIRVKNFGDEELEKKQEEKKKIKKLEKKAREQAVSGDDSAKQDESTKENEVEAEVEVKAEEPKQEKKVKKEVEQKEFHSQNYQKLSESFDKIKLYTLTQGLELLAKLQRGKFDETVELHLNTISSGISGNVTLPHGTGKKTRVAIASDAVIAEVEKGIINFDILVAEPSMMGKLAKVAKVLGPRGLMPNPKNGTINPKPEEVAKKFEGGQINFKTEAKAPLMHLTVGKMSFGPEKLSQNVESLIAAIKKANIVNATLKSTMSPGIKIKI